MALKKLIESVEPIHEDIEKLRSEFIRGGGKVISDFKSEQAKEEWVKIILRIKKEAIDSIDEIVGNTMGITRTGWILQAIEDKLKKHEA